jgi:4-hydroxy-tetrahydrodipicolinate synthase
MRLGLENPNIVGIKEACGNISQITKLASLCRGCVDIYAGNDDQIIPILSLGGIGVVSVLSNVAPQGTHDMVMAFLNGDVEKARRMQLDYLELVDDLFCEVNPIPVKSAMNMLGFNVGSLRLPLTEMEDKHKVEMSKLLKRMPQEMLA